MRKIQEIINPFLSIVLGALLLLTYLNFLQGPTLILVLGILGLLVAAFYLCVGIFEVFLVEKLEGKLGEAFSISSVVVFPTFMFIYFLFSMIDGYAGFGPAAWVINIISMIASIGLAIVYFLSRFVKEKTFMKFEKIFAISFALVLLLDILFNGIGNPRSLGNISVVNLIIYATFSVILFKNLLNQPVVEQVDLIKSNPIEEVEEENGEEKE